MQGGKRYVLLHPQNGSQGQQPEDGRGGGGGGGGGGGKGSSSQYLDPREAPVAGQHNRAGTGAAGRKACASEHVGSVTVR